MIITGHTTSRLVELKKVKATDIFSEKYHSGGAIDKNGVDYSNSVDDEIVVYYINGMKYTDKRETDTWYTYFEFAPTPMDYTDGLLIKTIGNDDYIAKPKINTDVFITRQEMSIFKKNQQLSVVENLYELTTYGGGIIYNIIKNT